MDIHQHNEALQTALNVQREQERWVRENGNRISKSWNDRRSAVAVNPRDIGVSF